MIERLGSHLHCCAHCRCSYRSFSWFQKLERSGPRLADSFCTAAERNSLPKLVGIGEKSWNRRCTRPGAGNLQWPCCVIPIHGSTRQQRNRYRAFLQVAVPALALASPEEERTNPDEAEDGYESANSWLLAQTMDRERFRLQFAENINYGFRRNVLGPSGHGAFLPGGDRDHRGWDWSLKSFWDRRVSRLRIAQSA